MNASSVAPFVVTTEGQYTDWKIYLPKEAFMAGSPNAKKVAAYEGHIARNEEAFDFEKIIRKYHFDVNLEILTQDEVFRREWDTFPNDLLNEPETTVALLGIAMHHRVLQMLNSNTGCLQRISPRILGFGPVVKLKTLKMTNRGKMVSFTGTVTKLGTSEIIFNWMAFKCQDCNAAQSVLQPDGNLTLPKSCTAPCRVTTGFEPLLTSSFTRTEGIQTILVEESVEDRDADVLRPRNIEVELSNDLVDTVCPGDDVTVTGVLKLRTQEERQKDKAHTYTSYIRAVNLISHSNPLMTKTVEFTEKSLQAIQMIKSDPFTFRLLVHSLCPDVSGHEMVKAALLLGLFSGNLGNPDFRSEVHILMVGDPGLGKSCILKACASAAPRGIFTSCSSSSVTGLTATVKNEKGQGAALEAGALVLADQGVCCIDEFDKVATNHASMLEVMEQQRVSVAKAGVVCNLPARTTILAAGNPVSGHYDRSKTVSENLKLHPAILSRFDCVFILLDNQSKDFATLLAESTGQPPPSASRPSVPLKQRLRLRAGERIDALPHVLFQKYIAYAQKKIKVHLAEDAGQLLKEFYLELRRTRVGSQCIPVTVRQMEALVRMTIARARIDLSEVAGIQHAQEVIELMKESMVGVLSPDGGDTLDWQRGINGSGMSKSSQAKLFLAEIRNRAEQKRKSEFHLDEFTAVADRLGIKNVLSDLIDSLNLQGYIIKRGNGFYKIL